MPFRPYPAMHTDNAPRATPHHLVTTAATAAAVLLLSACTATTSTTSSAEAQNTLRIAVSSDQGCMDPQQASSNDSTYPTRQLADSLTDQDPETGEIVPWLAEEWEISDDATEFTFTLRDDITFSDGTVLDAEAVAANFDTAGDLGARASLPAAYLQGYEETVVHDPLRFTVRFSAPNAQFLQATSTHSLAILAPSSLAEDADARCAGVIGSGPFVLEQYTPQDSATMRGREDYAWGSSLWDNAEAPHLDGLEFSVIPESGVRAGALQSDQADLIGSIAPQDEALLDASGAQLLQRTNPGVAFGLRLNHEEEVFADHEVRHAVSLYLDREEIVDIAYFEDSRPATSVLAASTPGHTDLSEELRHNPQEAQELLEGAGFTRDAEDFWQRDGERLGFTILWFDNSPHNVPALELIQQQLRDAGVDVELEEGRVADWQSRLAEGSFQTNWTNTTRAEADVLRTNFHSELANDGRLEPSALDGVLESGASAADEGERHEHHSDAQRLLVEDYLYIPVVELDTMLAARPEVEGFRFDSGSRMHLNDVRLLEHRSDAASTEE